MKIVVMGYSGSGKSTLAKQLAQRYDLPLLYLDTVWFRAGWQEREPEAARADVAAFLRQDSWVIDGNYTNLSYERRNAEADVIIQMLFNRLDCLFRCARRYRTYKGKSRPSMAEGCNEKLDPEFVRWILWEGRSRKIRDRYRRIREQYPDKVIVLRNQRQLDAYLKSLGL